MKFLLLIYEPEQRFVTQSQEAMHAEIGEYHAFGEEFAGAIRGGDALEPTNSAKTVRVRNAQPSVTDGPFAETKEQLGGYYVVEAADIDDAARIAARIPGARHGCVEVRPVMTFG
jgi:hypothetical protein